MNSASGGWKKTARPSHAAAIEQLWVADCNMVMQGAPIAADLDGDGNAEFLTAAYQAIIAVDGTGTELWRFTTKWRYMTCPAILERPGELALVYAADMTWSAKPESSFSCIDGAGKVVWQAKVASVFWASPALADINGDGRIEVIQGDSEGVVHVYDALTGRVVWERKIDGECSSPAVGDLDGDSRQEIVIATTTGKLYILSVAGEIVNEVLLGGTIFDPAGEYAAYRVSSPVIFANSKGQVCITASVQEPGSRRFLCLDASGRVMWERPTVGGVASTVSVADFDGDGQADLFAVTQAGRVYRYDEDGRVLWDIETQGFCYAPGAIIDVDGDGALEYVLCTELGNILVFNQGGALIFNHQRDSRRAIRTTPAFGRIAEGGLAFAVTGGDTGRIYCFGIPASADTRVEWRAFRGESRATGTWFRLSNAQQVRMVPENLAWDRILTNDEVTFRVTNPRPGEAPLQAEAAVVAPDGSRHAALGVIVGGSGVLKMPVAITAPGTYRFEWAVKDSSGTPLTNGSRDVTITPYANDQALARQAVLALGEAIGEAPVATLGRGLRALLYRELQAIEQEATDLAYLQAAAPGSAPTFAAQVAARTSALTTRAKRASVLANIAPQVLANAPGFPLVVFEGRTWENRDVDKELPTEVSIPLRIRRRCVTGEHEPVSIKLLNVTLDAAMVQTSVETGPGGLVVTPHEVKPVPTNPDQGTVAWDPIVPLEGRDSVKIPSFETREVWLDIDATGATAGEHHVNLDFRVGTKETRVEITLDVLPFEMAGFDSMRLCTWASYSKCAVADLLAHGNTVFITGVPPATIVQQGNTPRVEVNSTALDDFVAPLVGHDVFLLLTGVPSLGAEMEDDAFVPRMADYLEQVMSHLAAKGIPEDHVALYTWDEVGGNGWDAVRRYVAFGRQALKARPSVKFYVNGGGDLPMFEELAEIAGIWSPAFFMLDEHTPVMDFLRSTKAAMWSYNCGYMYARPLGWNTKAMNIVGEFRMQAVFAAHYGATGIGYWCYNHGPSMWNPIHPEYPIVYHTTPDGPITSSRRWEAVRESVEDARILVALREKLADGSIGEAAKAKIRHLLDVTLPGMADKSLTEMHLGTARYVIDDTNNDVMVETFRRELLHCVALTSK